MSATAQLALLDPAEELAAAKANPDGAWLSPEAQALYEREGALRFAAHHPTARLPRPIRGKQRSGDPR
jgi:hypothetical protein